MPGLGVVRLGTHRIADPEPGEPPFLSAASGTAWSGERLYTVGDDQAVVVEFDLPAEPVLDALRTGRDADVLPPGTAERLIADVLPEDPGELAAHKPDFEAMTLVTPQELARIEDGAVRARTQRRFPHGLLLLAGSGGHADGGRRSTCIVLQRDEAGHVVGLPARLSLEGLHEELEGSPWLKGELNLEGIAVDGTQLVLAQRGNRPAPDGTPGRSALLRLSLAAVLESLVTDLRVDRAELEDVREYDLGSLPWEGDGERHDVALHFSDLDAVAGDPEGRLVFTASAEGGDDQGAAKGQVAGSIVGVLDARGDVVATWPLEDTTIKLEGIDGRWTAATGTIDVLLVSDADDPDVPAPLMAARLPAG